MADNTTLPGTGDVYASDDISSVKFQRVKIVHGTDGVNDGDVAATNPLPVSVKCQGYTVDTTTTPLNNGASYTTSVFDSSCGGPGMTFMFIADQSALLEFLESHDNVTYYTTASAPYPGASFVFNEMHVAHARYWKIKITNNSGTNMTTMVMQTIQRVFGTPWKIKIDENGNAVTQGTDTPWQMEGVRDNNGAGPGATNIGVIPAICQASVPTYTDGRLVLPTTTTTGDTRVTLDGETVTIGSLPNEGQQTMANSISIAIASDQGNVPVSQGTASSLKMEPSGNVAHDATDSGNPIKVGAKAETQLSTITPVVDGDRTDLYADSDGVQYTKLFPEADLITERVADTAGNSTAFTNFGATASARNLIYGYSVFNASATDGYVDFRDGTAGSILFTVPAPKGGGANVMSPFPILKTTANTALAYDVSGALTTVYISVVGRKSKVT